MLEKVILASENIPFLGNSLFFLNRVENTLFLDLLMKIPFFLFEIALDFFIEEMEGIRKIYYSPSQPPRWTPRLGSDRTASNLGHHATQIHLIPALTHK